MYPHIPPRKLRSMSQAERVLHDYLAPVRHWYSLLGIAAAVINAPRDLWLCRHASFGGFPRWERATHLVDWLTEQYLSELARLCWDIAEFDEDTKHVFLTLPDGARLALARGVGTGSFGAAPEGLACTIRPQLKCTSEATWVTMAPPSIHGEAYGTDFDPILHSLCSRAPVLLSGGLEDEAASAISGALRLFHARTRIVIVEEHPVLHREAVLANTLRIPIRTLEESRDPGLREFLIRSEADVIVVGPLTVLTAPVLIAATWPRLPVLIRIPAEDPEAARRYLLDLKVESFLRREIERIVEQVNIFHLHATPDGFTFEVDVPELIFHTTGPY